jgi:hypothetical protein
MCCTLAACLLQVYTIRSSNLIYAFSKLDTEATGRVVEEEEETAHIEQMVREKLLNKLRNCVGEGMDETEVGRICDYKYHIYN